MPSFSSQFRVIVDPVAAEDANKVRARVARSHPGRQSPLFHNSATFMRQGTPSGRKIREGLALAAATLEDPVLMKARIARLQHDILSLERETEKALRASANVGDGGHHAGLQRCLHDHGGSGTTGSGVTLRSIPIEDLRTALNLAAYVPDDPAGNAVRLHALTQLLLTAVDAWAETQIEWVRGFAERIVGVRLPSERELLPLPAAAGAAVPSSTSPAKARKPSTVAAVAAAAVAADASHQHDESSVGGVLFLSRLLGCSAAPPLVTALLKGVVDTHTSVADKEHEIKQRVLGQNRAPSPSPSASASGAAAGSPARSLTRRRLAAYEQQQQIQLFYQLQAQLAHAGVPGFAADRRVHALASDDDDMVDKASQTDQALVRVLLRKYRGSDGDDSTDAEDAARGKQAQKRVPIRTANARTALRGASSSPVAERQAFAVNVSTRVQLEEANMRIAELQRQLLFYKSLESLVAEADVIGAVTDLNFKCETLANLGLDAQSLVRNYEAAVAAAAATLVPNPSSASASLAGAPSETDFGAPSPTRDAAASGVAAAGRSGGGGRGGGNTTGGGGAAGGARAGGGASPAGGAASSSNASGQPQGGAAATGTTAATAASPSKKSGGGGGGKGGDAAGGALAVPLAVHEAALEENRRLRGLLTVQQAVLSAVVNELDVADAFRDWVAWRRAVLAGGDAVRRATESLRVPVCADDALAAELAEELESGASSASDGGESRSSAPRSPSQRTSPGTSARAGAAAAGEDALESTLTRGETDELGKSRSGARTKPAQLPSQAQQQLQQAARRASKQQGDGRHEPFGPTDVAYRRAVRENMALQRTLDKVLHRLTLLESRKG